MPAFEPEKRADRRLFDLHQNENGKLVENERIAVTYETKE